MEIHFIIQWWMVLIFNVVSFLIMLLWVEENDGGQFDFVTPAIGVIIWLIINMGAWILYLALT